MRAISYSSGGIEANILSLTRNEGRPQAGRSVVSGSASAVARTWSGVAVTPAILARRSGTRRRSRRRPDRHRNVLVAAQVGVRAAGRLARRLDRGASAEQPVEHRGTLDPGEVDPEAVVDAAAEAQVRV